MRITQAARGLITDTLINVKTGKRTVLNCAMENAMVDSLSKLVAALLKNQVGFSGIGYVAIGEGDPSWDSLTLANLKSKSAADRTTLYNELARVVPSISFLDGNGDPTASVTNRLEIVATFGITISGYVREFGAFGGDATSSIDTGYLIDHRAHEVISFNTSGEEEQLERKLELIL